MSQPDPAADDVPDEARAAYERHAYRLHHLSMRYGGAVAELGRGDRLTLLARGMPGLKEVRDLVDSVLLTRAEINALTALLLRAQVFTPTAFVLQAAEEYEHLTQAKAGFLGVEVNDAGLVIRRGDETVESLERLPPPRTWRLVTHAVSGQAGIHCLRCDRVSWHPEDVRSRYCGHCHEFHEDPGPEKRNPS